MSENVRCFEWMFRIERMWLHVNVFGYIYVYNFCNFRTSFIDNLKSKRQNYSTITVFFPNNYYTTNRPRIWIKTKATYERYFFKNVQNTPNRITWPGNNSVRKNDRISNKETRKNHLNETNRNVKDNFNYSFIIRTYLMKYPNIFLTNKSNFPLTNNTEPKQREKLEKKTLKTSLCSR